MKKTGFWIGLIGMILLASIAALLILSNQPNGTTARILQNGEEVETVDLSNVKEGYTITIEAQNGGQNLIEIEPGRIRISEADCPDQICVQQGWISTSAMPIVCLPHGLVIEIAGSGEEEIDSVAQ